MKVWRIIIFSFAAIFASLIVGCGYIEKPPTFHTSKTFYIKAFDGLLEFPAGFYFDSSSIEGGRLRFSNLGIYDADLLEEPDAVISVGKRDEETLRMINGADMKRDCYGFHQAVQSIKSDTGEIYPSAVFYDEKVYVLIMSDSSELWFDALRIFRKSNNDLEGKCLGR
jgi:hypothetical protein